MLGGVGGIQSRNGGGGGGHWICQRAHRSGQKSSLRVARLTPLLVRPVTKQATKTCCARWQNWGWESRRQSDRAEPWLSGVSDTTESWISSVRNQESGSAICGNISEWKPVTQRGISGDRVRVRKFCETIPVRLNMNFIFALKTPVFLWIHTCTILLHGERFSALSRRLLSGLLHIYLPV
jgi:hypothetical protein